MVFLGARMGIEPLDWALEQRARERTYNYQMRILALDTTRYPTVKTALAATFERAGWFGWAVKAEFEADVGRREEIIRQGIGLFPKSAELHGTLANFMVDQRGNLDEAERLYRQSLEIDPENATTMGEFANFMADRRGNLDEAERLYRQSLEIDPKNAPTMGDFASFMADQRGNHDEAERFYRKALKLEPQNAIIAGNFALFLAEHGGLDEAENQFRASLELQPNNATVVERFATFMADRRKDLGEAERLYRRSLELDPTSARITANLAEVVLEREHPDEALPLLAKAWQLNGQEANELAGAIALTQGIAQRCAGVDDGEVLGRLKTLLKHGFERGGWSFNEILEFAKGRLTVEDHGLYSALARALLDQAEIVGLEKSDRWLSIEAVPLSPDDSRD